VYIALLISTLNEYILKEAKLAVKSLNKLNKIKLIYSTRIELFAFASSNSH
jgi:hypothetical protein